MHKPSLDLTGTNDEERNSFYQYWQDIVNLTTETKSEQLALSESNLYTIYSEYLTNEILIAFDIPQSIIISTLGQANSLLS